MRARCVAGFTLIELLVVIAIMGILIAVTLPSFTGMGRGSKMNAALLQVRTTLSLARQWAITHREETCVVFPEWANDTNKAYRAFAVYGSGTAGYLSPWNYLPDGVVFPTPGSGDIYTLGILSNGLPGFSGAVRVLRFEPDGKAKWNAPFGGGSSFLNIYLTEGWVDASGAVEPRPNSYTNELEINGLTGIARYRSF